MRETSVTIRLMRMVAEARRRRIFRRAFANRDGMAATEFALILPIMALLFFGMLETSEAMMANRRVTNAVNALVDLVGQEKQVTTSDVTEIFTGVTNMLEPTQASNLTMRLASVSIDPDDSTRVRVEWSRDNQGATPYAANATYTKLEDITILQAGVSLVVAEIDYEYDSGLTNMVIGSPIDFRRTATRWPRRSTRVKLCTPNYSTCW